MVLTMVHRIQMLRIMVVEEVGIVRNNSTALQGKFPVQPLWLFANAQQTTCAAIPTE